MRHHFPRLNIMWAALFPIIAVLSLNGCGDVSTAPAPTPAPAAPGPLAILTSDPLPAGTVGVNYDVTLAPNGGTAPYTWALAAGSPALPNGLALTPADGKISGKPTNATGTILTEFKLQDSKGQSVQKVLSITVNVAPTPLTILTSSPLPGGSINQAYAIALSGTGGTTPYTWGLKAGSPPLPSGLTLAPSGVITGTPTVTSNASHTFTLTDATSLTVEKTLALTISAIPLSITTASLPQATANQNYSAQLAASGGTGAYTWGFAGGSPALPTGLTLDTSTGAITGLPTGTSNQNITFTVTDQTPPTPQTATKTLQLIVGAAAPPLTIQTSSLPSGTVTVPYPSTTLAASGGTPPYTLWSTVGGLAPAPGLTLSSSGVISGTPSSNIGSPFTRTYQVQDSAVPPQIKTKDLTITVGLPTALNITTTTLSNGVLNQPYSQTVQATGGAGTRTWSFLGGTIPNLTINSSTGVITGNPTPTGQFTFTVQVSDLLFTDTQDLTITITAPPPPTITTSSLPTGTVNVDYPSTILQATGGAPPLTWQAVGMPFGLTFTAATATISGTPLSSGGPTNVTFTVNDSTVPFNQTGTRTLSLTVNAALTIGTTSPLSSSGTVGNLYGPLQLLASGGAPPYSWSITGTGAPSAAAPGLTLSLAGVISGTPTTAVGSPFTRTYRVQDNNGVTVTKSLALAVNAALVIDTPSPLPNGKVGDTYSTPLAASGGTGPYTWTIASDSPNPIPSGLTLSAGGVLSGTPTVGPPTSVGTHSLKFTVTDQTAQSVSATLSLTIAP